MLTPQRIDEIASGIDFRIENLTTFSESLREVKCAIQELRQSQESAYMWELQKLRVEFETLRQELQKRGLPEVSRYEHVFQQIKDAIHQEDWPKAVDPSSICITEDMATKRANAILDLVVGENLQKKSFLDFGCGEGHIVMQAMQQNPKHALGYDINAAKFKFQNEQFTSELDVVKAKGPYDVVLLHDVLDHLEHTDAISVLKTIKSLLSRNGRVYVRNHPWCSRHGSHIYTQINKAFAHLTMDDSELLRLGGYTNEHTTKIFYVLETYRHWITESGYKVCNEVWLTKPVEAFFRKQSFVKDRLLIHWGGDEANMINNMEVEFVEYVLEPSDQQVI